ncbi:glycosyltransferase [Rossellomorea aquimaris]|uniref:glycosyltransferase n=1 Tax=Rossellomorea aquimaris TaxID=189382 RepID=UPI0007D093D4|nr:glycosyltransferase family 2 protein [Rossellomorea aquimaris]
MVKISLCMIVKDEEESIERCLNSVKGVVDEIIIVDTGSTDKTVELCQNYQSNIVKYTWNGSFADARNFGIQKATGDWILWLDADEELDLSDQSFLKERKNFNKYDVINLRLINYYGKCIDEDNTTEIAHTRLFRNKGIRFINNMHERLDLTNISKDRIGFLPVKVYHYGYLDSTIQKKKKPERNMGMLMRQIEEGENIYWAHYFIALEYYNKKQYSEALEHVNLSILSFLENGVLPQSMVYKLKYSILIAMGKFKEALLGIEKALKLYPDYVDLVYLKGVILYYLKKYEDAIQCFKDCIEMGEENKHYLILKGVGSFLAWNYISRCHQKLKNAEEAIVSIMRSLLLSPSHKDSQNLLSSLLNNERHVPKLLKKHFNGKERLKLEEILTTVEKKNG